MEEKLLTLIEGNSETIRNKWAMGWKQQGKKIIGTLSSYVPEEIIWAAGMLPWRITGSWKENIPHAKVYRSDNSCSYCNHVLESVLNGELDFLDGLVTTDLDQDLLRLGDVIASLNKFPFVHIMHIPFVDSELNYKFFAGEITRFSNKLGKFGGTTITTDSLTSSINSLNIVRNLLNQIYELRKKDVPPLSGAEILGILTTAQIMPRDILTEELEAIIPYLNNRKTNLKQLKPRIMVATEMLDNPAYIKLVEENCIVAMDDTDTGSRYINLNVDLDLKDPAYALAKRYLHHHGAPRMAHWDRQIQQIIDWVKEYKIDGIINLPHAWCYPQRFRMAFLMENLEEAGIPTISLEREYHLANVGQLRTRIGAFLEMITIKQVTQ
ncbi:MAG: 2-hydroxyacyl-CoA dehydratase [Dehalococcoidales bacterium]|nr:2-hydroxyacyl-CoA dehydratase [Dehalococcoidales bacterium]